MRITNNGLELTSDEVKAVVRSSDGNHDPESSDILAAMRMSLIQNQVPASEEDKIENFRAALHESIKLVDRLKKMTSEADAITRNLQLTMDYLANYLGRRGK